MPLTLEFAELFERIAKKTGDTGAFCSLGRPWPVENVTYRHVLETAERYSKKIAIPDGVALDENIGDVEILFDALNFQYHVIDLRHEGDAGSTHYFDLNQPTIPIETAGKFDCIMNQGTLEHIFHIPNALANISKMLKVGGRVIHHVPINNSVGHGFYQISPSLFFDYYHVNRFEIEESVIKCVPRVREDHPLPDIPETFYNPYNITAESYQGDMREAVFIIQLVARKTAESTNDQIPSQGSGAGDFAHSSYAANVSNYAYLEPNADLHKVLHENRRLAENQINLKEKITEQTTTLQKVVDHFEERIERLQNHHSVLLREKLALEGIDVNHSNQPLTHQP